MDMKKRALEAASVGYNIAQFKRRTRWSAERIKAFQRKRLEIVLAYARQHSPQYREIFSRNGDAPVELANVPITSKELFLERFSDIVTDQRLTQRALRDHPENPEADSQDGLDDDYAVLMTGGTSGRRLQWARSRRMAALQCAVRISRLFYVYDRKHMRPRWALISSPDRRHGPRAIWEIMPTAFVSKLHIPVLSPLEYMAGALVTFQPTLLQTFPSVALRLAHLVQTGTLKLNLSALFLAGENLPDEVRSRLADAFQCPVRQMWSCTELGQIAQDCSHGRLHINEDVVFLEAVDEKNRPIRAGQLSDGVLVTHLWNLTVPTLRYRLDDQVRLAEGPCSCGSGHRWISEFSGRKLVDFAMPGVAGPPVNVSGFRLNLRLLESKDIAGAQVVLEPGARLRVNAIIPDRNPSAVISAARTALEELLTEQGVDIKRVTIDISPVADLERLPVSGKIVAVRNLALNDQKN